MLDYRNTPGFANVECSPSEVQSVGFTLVDCADPAVGVDQRVFRADIDARAAGVTVLFEDLQTIPEQPQSAKLTR